MAVDVPALDVRADDERYRAVSIDVIRSILRIVFDHEHSRFFPELTLG